jgi:MoxR-like ATPase
MPRLEEFAIEKVVDTASLQQIRQTVRQMRLAEEMVDYVVDLIRATRAHPSILHGASPRAANMLATAARALAGLRGRDYVIPDDVKELLLPVLRHRIVLSPSAEIEGQSTDGVLEAVLQSIPAPR